MLICVREHDKRKKMISNQFKWLYKKGNCEKGKARGKY